MRYDRLDKHHDLEEYNRRIKASEEKSKERRMNMTLEMAIEDVEDHRDNDGFISEWRRELHDAETMLINVARKYQKIEKIVAEKAVNNEEEIFHQLYQIKDIVMEGKNNDEHN